jgi:NADH-quinone oxidoreductase subunit E
MMPESHMEVRRFAHGSRVPDWEAVVDLPKDPAELPDPATTPVPVELRAEIERHIAKYPDRRSAAIPALAAAQRVHGWCSPEAFIQVACVIRLTPAYLISVATFYDMLETTPPIGKRAHRRQVYVCTNISCSLRGGRGLLADLEAAIGDDPGVNVRAFECLGACDIAPMVSVDGVYVGPVEGDEVVAELARQVRDGEDPLPERQLLHRPSVDPGANSRQWQPTEFAGPARLDRPAEGVHPLPPEPSSFGVPMTPDPDLPDGPSAPIEQAPSPPEEGPSQEEGTP